MNYWVYWFFLALGKDLSSILKIPFSGRLLRTKTARFLTRKLDYRIFKKVFRFLKKGVSRMILLVFIFFIISFICFLGYSLLQYVLNEYGIFQ